MVNSVKINSGPNVHLKYKENTVKRYYYNTSCMMCIYKVTWCANQTQKTRILESLHLLLVMEIVYLTLLYTM